MTLEHQLQLSYYRQIGWLDQGHGVRLVQHVETRQVFVMKTMEVYDLRVFQYLASHQVPGTPPIRELVEDDGVLYIVEEYVSGETLRQRLDREGPMAEGDAVRLVAQVCEILEPLHRLEPPIVHRDIKPENLILTSDGRVVLVDFNSAKETRRDQGQDTVLIGTAGYAAPEQYGFSSSRPTADVYALGVLLNELITGHRPSEGLCGGRRSRVVQRCIQMDPANRYQTAEKLQWALEDHRLPERLSGLQGVLSWLPPGFRSLNPGYMLLGGFWYAVILSGTFGLTSDGSPTMQLLMQLTFFLLMTGETFWLGNYRHLWKRLPMSSSDSPGRKAAGVALWAVVYFVAVMVFMPTLAHILE